MVPVLPLALRLGFTVSEGAPPFEIITTEWYGSRSLIDIEIPMGV